MQYTVNILSDNEFEKLPYPETEVSFGIADPDKRTAYVRYNPEKDVMAYLINHEVEHLIEGAGGEHSDHFRHGVYYKGFGDLFSKMGAKIGGPRGQRISDMGAKFGKKQTPPTSQPSWMSGQVAQSGVNPLEQMRNRFPTNTMFGGMQ